MRLVTYEAGSGPRLGVHLGERPPGPSASARVLDVAAAASRLQRRAPDWTGGVLGLLRGGPEALDALRAVVDEATSDPAENETVLARLLAPVPEPPSLRDSMGFERHVLQATRMVGFRRLAAADALLERVAGGRRSLAGRLNRAFYEQPPYYLSNHASVVGPDAEVRIPEGCEQFDHELEWGAFIGVGGADIPVSQVHRHIGGYTIFNDFSARDIQFREMRSRLGPGKGKNFDTGNALGPCLLTPDEVPDPGDLLMRVRVNGEQRSRARTGEAYWSLFEQISYISRSETLRPGDFIGSGTASGAGGAGCGLEQGRFLSPGDVVELEVDRIGVLRNTVVPAGSSRAAVPA